MCFLFSSGQETPEFHICIFPQKKRHKTKEKKRQRKKGIKRSKLRQSALHIHWETAFIGKFENANMQALCRNLFLFCFFLFSSGDSGIQFCLRKKSGKTRKKHTRDEKKKLQEANCDRVHCIFIVKPHSFENLEARICRALFF